MESVVETGVMYSQPGIYLHTYVRIAVYNTYRVHVSIA